MPNAWWSWKDGHHGFVAFDLRTARHIDAKGVTFDAGASKYYLDFSTMKQTNQKTQYATELRSHVFKAVESPDWKTITGAKQIFPPAYDPKEEDIMGDELGDSTTEPVVELKCSTAGIRCVYRESLILQALSAKAECMSCKFQYAAPGPQPTGKMSITKSGMSCSGYDGTGMYEIDRYRGTTRVAYLPDNTEGVEALSLLEKAFIKGHLFQVADSVTTGSKNVVVWAGIHQKTDTHGGSANHGWPDPTYFDRLKAECAAVGIFAADGP
eukprot:gene5547-19719_t